MEKDVFCKIINGDIPSSKYYEDDSVVAIKNLNPEAPFHALIVPKNHIELQQVAQDNKDVLGNLLLVAKLVADQENLKDGYRLIINNGKDSGQEINHLHVHLLAGKNLGPNICK